MNLPLENKRVGKHSFYYQKKVYNFVKKPATEYVKLLSTEEDFLFIYKESLMLNKKAH